MEAEEEAYCYACPMWLVGCVSREVEGEDRRRGICSGLCMATGGITKHNEWCLDYRQILLSRKRDIWTKTIK